jgi:phosphoribosylformylglycinamidine (FGAM) synthase-like amidotransferase family enzyme
MWLILPRVKKLREVEIANGENQINKIDLIVLTGGFSTTDHLYDFEIKSIIVKLIFGKE